MFLSRKYFTESRHKFFKSWCSHVWLWVSRDSGEGKQQGILCLLSVTLEQHRQQDVALAVRFVFGSHPAAVDSKCKIRASRVCVPSQRPS